MSFASKSDPLLKGKRHDEQTKHNRSAEDRFGIGVVDGEPVLPDSKHRGLAIMGSLPEEYTRPNNRLEPLKPCKKDEETSPEPADDNGSPDSDRSDTPQLNIVISLEDLPGTTSKRFYSLSRAQSATSSDFYEKAISHNSNHSSIKDDSDPAAAALEEMRTRVAHTVQEVKKLTSKTPVQIEELDIRSLMQPPKRSSPRRRQVETPMVYCRQERHSSDYNVGEDHFRSPLPKARINPLRNILDQYNQDLPRHIAHQTLQLQFEKQPQLPDEGLKAQKMPHAPRKPSVPKPPSARRSNRRRIHGVIAKPPSTPAPTTPPEDNSSAPSNREGLGSTAEQKPLRGSAFSITPKKKSNPQVNAMSPVQITMQCAQLKQPTLNVIKKSPVSSAQNSQTKVKTVASRSNTATPTPKYKASMPSIKPSVKPSLEPICSKSLYNVKKTSTTTFSAARKASTPIHQPDERKTGGPIKVLRPTCPKTPAPRQQVNGDKNNGHRDFRRRRYEAAAKRSIPHQQH